MNDTEIVKTESSVESLLKINEELAELYRKNASIGSESLAGESPLLKIHAAGRSSTNQMEDGKEPNDGWFFYKATKEQFQSIDCHILMISKGFRAEGIERTNVFNQIMAGIITNNDALKPFLMYFTGIKLSNLWAFGKEISKYTHAKPIPVPMFALKVRLTTKKETHKYGTSWVVNFEVLKNEDGSPILVTDMGRFQFLLDSVNGVQETIESLIKNKSTEEEIPSENEIHNEPEVISQTTEEKTTEEVNLDQIPF